MLEHERRRGSVLRMYDALSAGRLDGVHGGYVDAIFSPEARHHGASERLSDGPAGVRELYQELQNRLPDAVATVKRASSDGEYVAVHWHASTDPGDEFGGESWCEFFRFAGELIVEHWYLRVEVPPHTVSGRSVFSDAYPVSVDAERDHAAMTSINREIASSAFARFIAFDRTVLDDHWGDVYLQHNEMIPDGLDAIRDSLAEVGALPEEFRPAFTVLVTVADGDLVWFLERVRVGELTGFGVDIFRLDDRRIVEHWDIPALRPGSADGQR